MLVRHSNTVPKKIDCPRFCPTTESCGVLFRHPPIVGVHSLALVACRCVLDQNSPHYRSHVTQHPINPTRDAQPHLAQVSTGPVSGLLCQPRQRLLLPQRKPLPLRSRSYPPFAALPCGFSSIVVHRGSTYETGRFWSPRMATLVNATLGSLVCLARALPCFASYQIRILLDSFPEVIWGDGRDVLMLVNKKDAGPVLTLHEFL